jgi:light-regulated signal transduction histidine kinase (bacteriophytochrome)
MMEDAEEARLEAERVNEELGREIEQRNRIEVELARSNTELEQFAYVASHDLQEPLRKVQAFGDRLETKYAELLDARGRDYLARMQNAARRMRTMITDLLSLSRVTTHVQPFAPADLNQITQEAVSDLEIRIEQSGGRIEVGDLPTIEADHTQIRQLLENLIGNALKFHREGVTPMVKVTSQILEGQICRIAVEDNGIGFNEAHLERIFQPFQRLHGRGEYEGSGIGLAICRKIVERHGGSITARSVPGEGTTFTVELPISHRPQGGKIG